MLTRSKVASKFTPPPVADAEPAKRENPETYFHPLLGP